jgi:hypothetical protein
VGQFSVGGNKHGSAVHAVHAVQPLDGEKALPGGLGGISAPENGQRAAIGRKNNQISKKRALVSSK